MMKLTWRLNGRTVQPNQVASELAKSVRRVAGDRLESAVRSTVCPVHGQRASNVHAVSTTGSQMKFEYNACCDELKAAIARRFR